MVARELAGGLGLVLPSSPHATADSDVNSSCTSTSSNDEGDEEFTVCCGKRRVALGVLALVAALPWVVAAWTAAWSQQRPVTTPDVEVPSRGRFFSAALPSGLSALARGQRRPAHTVTVAAADAAGPPACHDMLESDRGVCMTEINAARHQGITAHPNRYPGLSATSQLSRWQVFVSRQASSRGKCPQPCAGWRRPALCGGGAYQPASMWKPRLPSTHVQVKALSHNLFWWNLFGKNQGRDGSAGKLLVASMSPPFDVMGFQECEDYTRVLGPAGLSNQYRAFQGAHGMCMAYRKEAWALIKRGEGEVAIDQPTEYYGNRGTQWMRLRHLKTGIQLLFVNHHGPLSVNSGGQCGGVATANNLLRVIADNGQSGDLVILVGDFNANAASLTVQELWKHLVLVYNGDAFGGVDMIFSNAGKASISSVATLGNGGSDHNAISAIIDLSPVVKTEGALRGSAMAGEPARAVRDSDHSQCGLLESGVEYVFQGFVTEVNADGVGDPRVCCALCQGDRRCKAWVLIGWVASVGGPRCSLKRGQPSGKRPRNFVVSGLPTTEARLNAARVGALALAAIA